jgi:hypothetical protein
MSPQIEPETTFGTARKPEPVRPLPSQTVSSRNGVKSGLDADCQFVYGEQPDEFLFLQQEYFDRFQPFTPEERYQVDSLIRSEWSIRRLFRVEAHLWEYQALCADRSSGVPLGEGFSKASKLFMRLRWRIRASERTYKEAYEELDRASDRNAG